MLGRDDLGPGAGRERRGVVAERVLAHRVADQRLQLGVERAGDLGRARQVLVLLLAQPAEGVRDVEPGAVAVGAVLAAAVEDGAGVEQHRSGVHDGLGDLVRLGLAVVGPLGRAGDHLGRAVLGR